MYIPPDSSSDLYLEYSFIIDDIISRYPKSSLILTGDYNLGQYISWDPLSCAPIITKNSACADILISSSQFHRLFQLNHIQNINNVILDLVFSNNSQNMRVVPSDEKLLKPDPQHPPLMIEILNKNKTATCKKLNQSNRRYIIRNYKSGDYPNLSSYLSDSFCDQSQFPVGSDLDTLVECFYAILLRGIELHIPEKQIIPPKFPVWFGSEQ
uniref:Endonuclease/exonuclease/phosphatase domain-containing protein n=1 Tax=Cacopsylla melanoneura TaxID=428564 RepID=A0A8D9EWR7_9HEMI